MPIRRSLCFVTVCVLLSTALSSAANPESTPTIHDRINGMKAADGLFPTAWDGKSGKFFLEIRKFDQDFLLVVSLPYGLGSNDIGLDRGRLGEQRIVHFTRVGPRVLLVAPNLQYRSSSTNPMESLAVRQSFAESVLAAFKIEAEEDGAVLIDATDFVLQDSFGAGEQLVDTKQGAYKLDKERSAFALENTKNFPLNTEFESILTFTTEHPAEHSVVATVTPDAHAVTLREHYSFVQLPDDGYRPRAFDPRSGFFDTSYRDYSAPLGSALDVRLIERHRLIKKDPDAAVSEPVKPLVYYVDPGAPEPIRSALVEGASWWNQEAVFQATWKAPRASGFGAEMQRITEVSAVEHLLALAANHGASPEARALARAEALSLRAWLSAKAGEASEEKAVRTAAIARIEAFEKDPEKFVPASDVAAPPGQPIGDDEQD